MQQVPLLHRIAQNAAQRIVDALYRFFGQRFAVGQLGGLAHFLVKMPDDLLAQVGQFVVPQRGQNPPHILLVAGISGFRQFLGATSASQWSMYFANVMLLFTGSGV